MLMRLKDCQLRSSSTPPARGREPVCGSGDVAARAECSDSCVSFAESDDDIESISVPASGAEGMGDYRSDSFASSGDGRDMSDSDVLQTHY